MSRARNIESEPTRKNVMEGDAAISRHAYEMQLRSESRYAIGSFLKQEEAQSVVNSQFSEFLAEQGIQYQSDINVLFREFIEGESKHSQRDSMRFGWNSVHEIGLQKQKNSNPGTKSKIGIEPFRVQIKIAIIALSAPLPRMIGSFGIAQRNSLNQLWIIQMRLLQK